LRRVFESFDDDCGVFELSCGQPLGQLIDALRKPRGVVSINESFHPGAIDEQVRADSTSLIRLWLTDIEGDRVIFQEDAIMAADLEFKRIGTGRTLPWGVIEHELESTFVESKFP
jgi:hypothetical protein